MGNKSRRRLASVLIYVLLAVGALAITSFTGITGTASAHPGHDHGGSDSGGGRATKGGGAKGSTNRGGTPSSGSTANTTSGSSSTDSNSANAICSPETDSTECAPRRR